MTRAAQLVRLQVESTAAGEMPACAKWFAEEWAAMPWESDGGEAFVRSYDAPEGVSMLSPLTGTTGRVVRSMHRLQMAYVRARDASLWADVATVVPGGDGEAGAGLVSVPTTWETDRLAVAQGLELLVMTPSSKAKRRLACLRRSIGFSARGHAVSQKGHRKDVAHMVTLTYRPGVAWESGHMASAMLAARDWCRSLDLPFRYVWIAEIQDGKRRADGVGRDVIHYHMVMWLPVGVRCPHFDTRGWWPHGLTQSTPPQKVKDPVAYLLHYLKKDKDLRAMPKGARAYGIGGLDLVARRARRWLGLPAFVRGNSDIWDNWRRAVGGGWLSPGGVHFQSEFQRVKLCQFEALQRVCTHSIDIIASGPFSWLTRVPGS